MIPPRVLKMVCVQASICFQASIVKTELRDYFHLRYGLTVSRAKKGENGGLSDYAAKFASRGGKARAKALSAEQRREIARKAAAARWRKEKS